MPLLQRLYEKHDPSFIAIESVAFQKAIVQEARRAGLPVRELRAERDKVSRALVAQTRMEGGQVWFPRHADWLDEWENELLLFPNARHDDQVDTLSYAALQVAKGGVGPVMTGHQFGALNDALAQVAPYRI